MAGPAGAGEPRRMRPARVVLPLVIGLLALVAVGVRMCNPEPAVDQAAAVLRAGVPASGAIPQRVA